MGNLSVPWVLLFAVYFISSNSQLLQVPFAPYERGYAESAQGNINNILQAANMKFLKNGLCYKIILNFNCIANLLSAPRYSPNRFKGWKAFYPAYQTDQFRPAFGRGLKPYHPKKCKYAYQDIMWSMAGYNTYNIIYIYIYIYFLYLYYINKDTAQKPCPTARFFWTRRSCNSWIRTWRPRE